jgi:hypothetical protein
MLWYKDIKIVQHNWQQNMSVHLGNNRQNATQTVTVTHVKLKSLVRRVEGVGHKIYMDNFLSTLDSITCIHKLSAVVEM